MIKKILVLTLFIVIVCLGNENAKAVSLAARQYNEQGIALLRQGQLEGAREKFRLATEESKDYPEAYANLGLVYERLGDRAQAEQAYRNAVELNPDRFLSLQSLADLLASDPASRKEATEYYLDAIKVAPRGHPILLRAADSLKREGQKAESLQVYKRYLAEAPHSRNAKQVRSWIERLSVEIEADGEPVPIQPQDAEQVRNLTRKALDAYQQDRYEKARDLLLRAVEIQPDLVDAHDYLGRIYQELGKRKDAVREFERTLELEPTRTATRLHLADLLLNFFSEQKNQEAIDHYNRVIQEEPQWDQPYQGLGQAYESIGDTTKAIQSYKQIIVLTSDAERKQRYQQRVEDLQRKQIPRAIAAEVQAVSDITPTQSISEKALQEYRMAIVYRRKNQPEQAVRELKIALREEPKFVAAWNLMAEIQESLGSFTQAERSYSHSLEIDKGQGATWEKRGDLRLERLNAPDQAFEDYSQAAELGQIEAWLKKARYQWSQNRLGATRKSLEKYLDHGDLAVGREEAQKLLAQVESRQSTRNIIWLSIVAVLAAVGFGVYFRQRGLSLEAYIEREPSRTRTMVACLSNIRHEMIKHRTSIIRPFVERIRSSQISDSDLQSEVDYFVSRILGSDDQEDLPKYLRKRYEELYREAKRDRVTLNLLRKKGLARSLYQSAERLVNLCHEIKKLDGRIVVTRKEIHEQLLELHREINHDLYRDLGELLKQLTHVCLDNAWMRSIYDSVLQEREFRGKLIADPMAQAPGQPRVMVQIAREDMATIAINLIRNALKCELEEGKQGRIGWKVISGHTEPSHLARLHVRDSSPQMISEQQIQRQDPDRGLGLVRDLVLGYGGKVSVVAEEGYWTKSVVVALPSFVE